MNKEKMWKVIAIVACALLVIVALTSFTSALPGSQYYDICVELDKISKRLSDISDNLNDIWMAM